MKRVLFTQSSCEWFPVEDGKKFLSLPWFHTSPGDWLFMTVVILFQPISEAKPKAVVSLRSYFPALGTGYKYLLSRILIGFTLLLVIGCPKLSRYSFNQSPTCDKSVYHVVFSLAFIPEFCFLRCCCCCFCVFRDWFGST